MTQIFNVIAQNFGTKARTGTLRTAHGEVRTPAFMPVGTSGVVKTLSIQDLKTCGVQMVLANVYHLSIRPGQGILEAAGGLHRFMAWDGPILTDSGGYQVFSLATHCKVTDDGASFASPLDGAVHHFTPESVVDFQLAIGSDVVIPLDQCVAYPCEKEDAREALERTIQWAQRSKLRFEKGVGEIASPPQVVAGRNDVFAPHAPRPTPLLFGIVQGATYPDLRRQAVERMLPMEFDGYCLGGVSVGEPKGLMYELIPEVARQLPADRPRYLMGMGEPLDLIEAVREGVDLFDCVVPTRHGRNGLAYTWVGRINLRHAAHRTDSGPIDPDCRCPVCRTYSRMYLRHLVQTQEMLASRLLSFHNVWFYSTLMSAIREAIEKNRLQEVRQGLETAYQKTLEGVIE